MNQETDVSSDLKVGSDGQMTTNDGPVAITVHSAENLKPEINTITPPPGVAQNTKVQEKPESDVVNKKLELEEDSLDADTEQEAPQVHNETRLDASSRDMTGADSGAEVHVEPHSSHDAVAEAPRQDIQKKPEPDSEKNTQNSIIKPNQAHRDKKSAVAVVVILISVLLAGIAVFVYLSTESNATLVEPIILAESIDPATEASIDKVASEIDQTTENLDNSDFSDEAVTDESLGL